MTDPADPPASAPSRAAADASTPEEPVAATSAEPTSTEPAGASEPAQTEAAATDATESAQTTVSESATPAPAPPHPEAAPGGAVADPRLQALAGAGSLGLSREDLARLYPAMGDRFAEIDRDHDGRVSAAELVDAMQQAAPIRQTGSE